MIPQFVFHPGTTPLLISVPHCGTHVPDAIAAGLTEAARPLPDTDWHVDRLYAFARELGAGLLVATHSRYVIDLNRPPDGKPLYPGASNTELCPLKTFEDQPIWQPGAAPDEAEVARRRRQYWQPYHDQIAQALAEIKARHGRAVLFDGHSIASRLPRFFEGQLPDLNLGTADGAACDPELSRRVVAVAAAAAPEYSHVLNGRFKGGYITRAYGKPAEDVHALQLELGWLAYLDEAAPWPWDPERAGRLQTRVLQPLIETLLDWARA